MIFIYYSSILAEVPVENVSGFKALPTKLLFQIKEEEDVARSKFGARGTVITKGNIESSSWLWYQECVIVKEVYDRWQFNALFILDRRSQFIEL